MIGIAIRHHAPWQILTQTKSKIREGGILVKILDSALHVLGAENTRKTQKGAHPSTWNRR